MGEVERTIASPEELGLGCVRKLLYQSAKAGPLRPQIKAVIDREQKRLISEALTATRWNRSKAAKLLQVSYRWLLYRIKEYEIT